MIASKIVNLPKKNAIRINRVVSRLSTLSATIVIGNEYRYNIVISDVISVD